MATIDVLKSPTASPDDMSGLKLLSDHGYTAADLLAVIAKTEGNGCVNDFSRTLAAASWASVLPSDAVSVFSGGTEGVLAPHVCLVVSTSEATCPGAHAPGGALVAAVGRTGPVRHLDLGRARQATAVAEVVSELCLQLGLTSAEVHLVLVKCPLLTSDQVTECEFEGGEPVTRDTYSSMARSRAASALGVAMALGECSSAGAEAALRGELEVWSSVASVSSGAELEDCKVLVVGSSPSAEGPLRAAHTVMRDALDSDAVLALLRRVEAEGGEVVQVLAKAEADPSGSIRGRRHTMLTDSDLPSTRHARAAVGGLLAGLVGDSAIYVSGGAEHQGPPGGGPVTVLYRLGARRESDGDG